MKRKLSKILGVGLSFILVASLMVFAMPVSAGTLSWSASPSIPSETGKVIETQTINDIALSPDGTTVFAALTGKVLYKSTDLGVSWSALSSPVATTNDLVAVAPDNGNLVAVVDATALHVWISTNGGTSWDDLGKPQDGSGNAVTGIYDLAISRALSGVNYITVAGKDAAGASVHYFNYGAAVHKWLDAADATDWAGAIGAAAKEARAVEFSPNFPSDRVMFVVTVDTAGKDIDFQVGSFAAKNWNNNISGYGAGYPAQLDNTAVTALTEASIAVSPTYLGSDDSTRLVFVGVESASGADAPGGIYRLTDSTVKDMLTAKAVKSVAYNSAGNLVAGGAADNQVWRCANPTASAPTVSTASTYKKPGDNTDTTDVIVAWAGDTVIAGSGGTDGGFSVSVDSGKTFNDISLVNTAMTNVLDLAVSADGSKIYLVTTDNTNICLWRNASSWERVFTLKDAGKDYIVRPAPDNFDAVYLAKLTATDIYYSSDAGETSWTLRYCGNNIKDMAVESADVLYVAVNGAKTVTMSDSGGYIWGAAKTTGLGGNVHMIKSLGAGKLIVGSVDGYVAYSKNSNSSWTAIASQVNLSGTAVSVTASGLEDGDFIYAGSAANGQNIVRWTIGTSTSWSDIINGTVTVTAAPATAQGVYGLALTDSALYALASDGTDSSIWRTLSPSTADSTTGWSHVVTTNADNVALNDAPQGLIATTGSTTLWALSTSTDKIYSFVDTVVDAAPTLTGPANGATISVNPQTGRAMDVAFQWSRLSTATAYDLVIAFDSAFTQLVRTEDVASTSSNVVQILGPYSAGPSGNALEYLADTTYYWKVRVDAAGPLYSPYSEVRSFTVGHASAVGVVPTVAAPTSGATDVGLTPIFAWGEVPGATYTFVISTDAAFAVPAWTKTGLTTNVYEAEHELEYGTTYYWKVTAGSETSVGIFTTIAEPAAEVEKYTCPVCGLVFDTQEELAEHWATYHASATTQQTIPSYLLWTIIAIGAVLLVALIVLIVRTRRTI